MYDIFTLIKFLNNTDKPVYYDKINTVKVVPMSNEKFIRLEIDLKDGIHSNYIINTDDLKIYQRNKKINKIVNSF